MKPSILEFYCVDTGMAKSMFLGPGPSSHQAGNISHRISYSTQSARSPGGGEGGKKERQKENHRKFWLLPTVLPILTGGNGNTVPQLDIILNPPHLPTSVSPRTLRHTASDIHPAMPLVLPSGRSSHLSPCLSLRL